MYYIALMNSGIMRKSIPPVSWAVPWADFYMTVNIGKAKFEFFVFSYWYWLYKYCDRSLQSPFGRSVVIYYLLFLVSISTFVTINHRRFCLWIKRIIGDLISAFICLNISYRIYIYIYIVQLPISYHKSEMWYTCTLIFHPLVFK